MSKLNESQRRYKALFENYVDIESGEVFNNEFERDLQMLRSTLAVQLKDDDPSEKMKPVARFMVTYNFPVPMVRFIHYYVVNDEIDLSLIDSGMYIVSDANKKAAGYEDDGNASYKIYDGIATFNHTKERSELKLVIPNGVTLKQAKDFLTENWEFVRINQPLYAGTNDGERSKAVRPRYNARRDARVMRLVEEGRPYKEIAEIITDEFAVPKSHDDIAVIVRRQRSRRNKNISS